MRTKVDQWQIVFGLFLVACALWSQVGAQVPILVASRPVAGDKVRLSPAIHRSQFAIHEMHRSR